MDSTRWGWRCMLQLQETDIWKKPATTTWAAEFLLREGESREFLGERECCLLVLNAVTSTPQWIRQPKAAWGSLMVTLKRCA